MLLIRIEYGNGHSIPFQYRSKIVRKIVKLYNDNNITER